MSGDVTEAEVADLFRRLDNEAEATGYHLNPDPDFSRQLIRGLLVNERRYGYRACPCRLASGNRKEDLDITCPCDYRDADLGEYGTCYCALYVTGAVLMGEKNAAPIPERRPPPEQRRQSQTGVRPSSLPWPVWRCRVCGYLCARDAPPETCPVCKARKERFERFM